MYRFMIYQSNSASSAINRVIELNNDNGNNVTNNTKIKIQKKENVQSLTDVKKQMENNNIPNKNVAKEIKFSNDSSTISTNKSDFSEGSDSSSACVSSLPACDNDKNKKIKYEVLRLTTDHQIILQKTFLAIKERAIPNGVKLLLRMFCEHPDYKNIWPQFRPYPDSSLMCAPELSRHAKTYMKGLGHIIDSTQDEEKMCNVLQQIAKAHIKWNIHKKHVMHMLEQVLIMLADEIGPLDKDTKEAWTTLYDVIANMVDIFAGRR
uniref:GLOBIN domain-containing protein n=1 Tax=Parastrongyloides trichosuri TaxID=131310 RepID=A0A0N4ZBZ3_PARTI